MKLYQLGYEADGETQRLMPILDPTMTHTKKQRFWREYRAAVSEYHRLTNYLGAGRGVLTRPERALLVEFIDQAKRKSVLLRKSIDLHRVNQITD